MSKYLQTPIYVGDSYQWVVDLQDYPASDGWVLEYGFFNAEASEHIKSVAEGDKHLMVVASATSATWKPGYYDYTAYVKNGTQRKVLVTGKINILPDPASESFSDLRSHARIMLHAIEHALEGQATARQLDLIRGVFGGQAIEKDSSKLMEIRDKYRAEVRREDEEANLNAGGSGTSKIFTHF